MCRKNKKCVCLSLLLPSYQLLRFKASTWKGEELSHRPPASSPLSCSLDSALSVLIALVPSAGLIDQKGSECSSMFAWLNSGTAGVWFFLCVCVLCSSFPRSLYHTGGKTFMWRPKPREKKNEAEWSCRESWTSSIVFFYKRSVCEGVQHYRMLVVFHGACTGTPSDQSKCQ